MPAHPKRRSARETAKLTFLVAGALLNDLDKWVAEINSDGRFPEVRRADVLRAILARAIKERWGWPPPP